MNDFETGRKIMQWITLAFAVVFLILGILVISGAFFPGINNLDDTRRLILGIVLIGYGIVRITMIGRKFRKEKRRYPLAKKP